MNSPAKRFSTKSFCSSVCICSRVISSRAPNGSSKRARSGSATSARAIETRIRMPPDSARGCWCSNPVSPTRSSISWARSRRVGARRAAQLLHELDVAGGAAPLQQGRVLEDVAGGRGGDGDAAARGRLQAGREAQQRGLAAARRADDRDEVAGAQAEADVGQRDGAGRELLADAVEDEGRLRWSWAAVIAGSHFQRGAGRGCRRRRGRRCRTMRASSAPASTSPRSTSGTSRRSATSPGATPAGGRPSTARAPVVTACRACSAVRWPAVCSSEVVSNGSARPAGLKGSRTLSAPAASGMPASRSARSAVSPRGRRGWRRGPAGRGW